MADAVRGGGTDALTSGTTRIYLARHGRTPLNAAGVLRGRLDPPLDQVGRRQARRLGAALGRRGITVVVASPLRRAVDTAAAVAGQAGLSVETDVRLIDRGYGRWAGMRREAVEAQWGSLDDAPDVEPADDVRARAWDALNDLARRAAGGIAVAVSHDIVIRLALVTIDPELGDPELVPQGTGCFNTLEERGGRWTVVRVNEAPTDHEPDAVPENGLPEDGPNEDDR
ncbi:MAG TPA: histidine phosphatase family protein [Acidimicrobiales bacterium]|nr:histidine phosphatase family protein [Acidimicrobiales bacterium]